MAMELQLHGSPTTHSFEFPESQTTWNEGTESTTVIPNAFTPLSKSAAWDIYISHFLSTWNVRTYEFAAVLFTAAAYPDTLFASSIRGIVTTLAVLLFAAGIGSLIDEAPSRLRSLLVTIIVNRLTIVAASLLWLLIIDDDVLDKSLHNASETLSMRETERANTTKIQWSPHIVLASPAKNALFALILLLGILERLSGMANTLVMERDWVPVLVPLNIPASSGGYNLTHVNAIMRRIDLICKLVAPLVISFVVLLSGSARVGTIAVSSVSAASWAIEWWCARRVWEGSLTLRQPKIIEAHASSGHSAAASRRMETDRSFWNVSRKTKDYLAVQARQLRQYFSTSVWAPSMALAILYVNALSYGATFVTYLLNSGFTLETITIARTAGTIVEVLSTFILPSLLHIFTSQGLDQGHIRSAEIEGVGEHLMQTETETRVSLMKSCEVASLGRLGLWGLTSQFFCLFPVTLYVINLRLNLLDSQSSSSLTSSIFVLFLPLTCSRLGLWIIDICTQTLTTSLVPSSTTSSFAGTEQAFVALFELLQWIAAAVWSAPEDFWKLGIGSLGAVGLSAVIWAVWLRRLRGHLMHLEKLSNCVKGKS